MLKQSFNQNWILDPMDTSEFFMNPGSVKKQKEVTLPFDAMQLEKRDGNLEGGRDTGFYPSKECTLEKTFEVPEEWREKTVIFEFEGIYTNSMIYINGHYAGGCPHGYTTFEVCADPFLKYGEDNVIKVMAKTHKDSRWYTGVGIYRSVNLMVGELCHITSCGHRVSTECVNGNNASVLAEVELENLRHTNCTACVTTVILNAKGQEAAKNSAPLTLYGNEKETLSMRLYLPDVKVWNTENPYLYSVITTVTEDGKVLDEGRCHLGVRTLSLDPEHGLCINGETVKLRGACVHHDNGLLGAAAVSRAEERRVQFLKEAGFNAVRSAHNPVSTAFLDACDKYGIIVMDELTDMWTQRKGEWDYSTSFPTHWPKLVESIVAKDFNHPSVVLYSIGNEIQETGTVHGAKIGRRLSAYLKELDATRYTTNSVNLLMAGQGQVDFATVMSEGTEQTQNPVAAMGENGLNPEAMADLDINELMTKLGPMLARLIESEAVGKITEETFSCVDIAGYNYAASRYVKDKESYPSRIIVGSETFPKDIAKNWKLVKEYPHVIGDFTWTGWDYLGEAGIGAMEYIEDGNGSTSKYPWYIAYCGDLDITGFRRPASYYREIVFGLRKTPYVAVKYPWNHGKTPTMGRWDFVDGISSWTWNGSEGKAVEVEIYGVGNRAELFVNDEKVGEAALEEYKATIETTYQPGQLTAVCYENGAETGRYELRTAKESVHLCVKADRTELQADDTDLSYVEITLRDEDGVLHTCADRMVTVKIEGAGILAGLGSAKPTSEEYFCDGAFETFEGRLLAVIRPTETGVIRLTVEAESCESKEIEIIAKKKEERK